MDELRWILLIVGALIIGAVYYFGDPGRAEGRRTARSGERDAGDGEELDPALEQELERLGEVIAGEQSEGAASPAEAEPPIDPEPERVVVLYLLPRKSERIAGKQIFHAAEHVGMSFGALNIFHRYLATDDRRTAIYSLANITKPGDFDPAARDEIECQGLCLFLTLPNALDALDAWDAMLATGQRLADLLDADLTDEARSSLSRQRVTHLREQMREFDRKQNLRRGAR